MKTEFFELVWVGAVVDRETAYWLPVGSQIRRVDGGNPPYRVLTMYERHLYDGRSIGSGRWEIMRIGWGKKVAKRPAPSDQGSSPDDSDGG